MEAQDFTKTTCRGITKAKTACIRVSNLDANSFCHQHTDQVHHVVQPPQRNTSHNDNNSVPSSVPNSVPSSVPNSVPNSPPLSSEEVEDDAEPQVLTQCIAISRSTHARCRHHVSFVGEGYCPSHGGRQKAPLPPLMANALLLRRTQEDNA
jgi:hypothetical protein